MLHLTALKLTIRLIALIKLTIILTIPAHALIGGQAARSGEYSQTIRLKFRHQSVEQVCSGVLLGEKFILTAAHCFGDFNWNGWSCGEGLAPEIRLMNSSTPERAFRVQGIHIHPDITGVGFNFDHRPYYQRVDIALVELEAPLSASFVPARLSRTSSTPTTNLVIGGFGLTSLSANTYPQLPHVSASTGVLVIPKKLQIGSSDEVFLGQGDSGGPVYVSPSMQVVAVNSMIIPGRRQRILSGTREYSRIVGYSSYATPISWATEWIARVTAGRSTPTCTPQ